MSSEAALFAAVDDSDARAHVITRSMQDIKRAMLKSTPPNRDLVDRFDEAFRRHYDAVRRHAVRCGASDGDDVVAESFTAMWRHLEAIEPEAERTWLLSAVRKQTANQRRGAARRERLADTVGATLDTETESNPGSVASDPAVRDALSRLNPKDQEILLLSVWDGLKPAELSRVLGISRTAAAVRLHRARQRFRKEFGDARELGTRLSHPGGRDVH